MAIYTPEGATPEILGILCHVKLPKISGRDRRRAERKVEPGKATSQEGTDFAQR